MSKTKAKRSCISPPTPAPETAKFSLMRPGTTSIFTFRSSTTIFSICLCRFNSPFAWKHKLQEEQTWKYGAWALVGPLVWWSKEPKKHDYTHVLVHFTYLNWNFAEENLNCNRSATEHKGSLRVNIWAHSSSGIELVVALFWPKVANSLYTFVLFLVLPLLLLLATAKLKPCSAQSLNSCF